jgi:cell wall-associated NlpC family hydrolase
MSTRYRRRYRRRWSRRDLRQLLRQLVAVVVVGIALVGLVHTTTSGRGTAASASAGTGAPPAAVARPAVAARVIAYAREQLGEPYVWGGTGPGGAGFDCSGLAMEAYASAGISIPRTSQEQWAAGPQVSTPQAGDLVFFAGGDGTASSPGHVGIVVNPAAHTMIDAYVPGTNIRYDTYGLASSAGGLSDPVGFTQPWSHS